MKRKWTYKPSFFLRPILEIIAYLLTRERKGTETFHKALVQPPSVVGCDLPVNFLPRQRSEPFSMFFYYFLFRFHFPSYSVCCLRLLLMHTYWIIRIFSRALILSPSGIGVEMHPHSTNLEGISLLQVNHVICMFGVAVYRISRCMTLSTLHDTLHVGEWSVEYLSHRSHQELPFWYIGHWSRRLSNLLSHGSDSSTVL